VTLRTGDLAPEFTAPGTGGRSYSLSELRGAPAVLVFYPGDATPVCTEQLGRYTADFGQFAEVGAQIWALSPQDVESHERFQAAHGFAFPLLYDEGKRIGHDYGVVGPLGFYRRSVFVIDADGVVRMARRATAGLSYTPTADILEVLRPLTVR